jgi:predicted HicB family RNase H-like nuclease
MLHLPPEVKRQLEAAAAAAGVSQSVYAMQVLQAHFKRKGIE